METEVVRVKNTEKVEKFLQEYIKKQGSIRNAAKGLYTSNRTVKQIRNGKRKTVCSKIYHEISNGEKPKKSDIFTVDATFTKKLIGIWAYLHNTSTKQATKELIGLSGVRVKRHISDDTTEKIGYGDIRSIKPEIEEFWVKKFEKGGGFKSRKELSDFIDSVEEEGFDPNKMVQYEEIEPLIKEIREMTKLSFKEILPRQERPPTPKRPYKKISYLDCEGVVKIHNEIKIKSGLIHKLLDCLNQIKNQKIDNTLIRIGYNTSRDNRKNTLIRIGYNTSRDNRKKYYFVFATTEEKIYSQIIRFMDRSDALIEYGFAWRGAGDSYEQDGIYRGCRPLLYARPINIIKLEKKLNTMGLKLDPTLIKVEGLTAQSKLMTLLSDGLKEK